MTKLSNSPKAFWCLAIGLALCAPLPADAPSMDAASSPASLSPAAAALTPSALAASPSAQTYAGFISGTVVALGAPLDAFLAKSGKPSLSVAAGGFRELVTGERSPLCDHLDRDLTTRLRDATPYGVPSNSELQDAWISVGGNAADLTLPYTLRRFGRLMSVDAVVSGDYMIHGDSLSITVRLMDCANGSVLWVSHQTLPVAAVDRGDLNTYSASAPAGYGQQIAAPAPPQLTGLSTTASGTTPSAGSLETGPLAYAYSPPAGVELESNVHETEFSPYRINFGAGYEYFYPLNTTFRSVVKDMTGPYINLNWADIVHAEFFLWYEASLPSLPVPVSNLLGYGMTVSATLPVRVGHHWVFYGGLGGRFETISVADPDSPVGDALSFGNNSLFATAGAKIHRGDVGIDTNVAYDLMANDAPYWMVKLGLYYEYNFE